VPRQLFPVREGDRPAPRCHDHTPVVVVLDRLRSAFNVGNVFRLADATRAEKVVTCGYTAAPPHAKLAKTARGCDDLVATEHATDARQALTRLREAGYTLYAVETVEGSSEVWNLTLRFPAAFVFGNEALGISPDALELCDCCVQVPCLGYKNSINVANCAAVVLYEGLHQWLDGQ